MNISLAPETIFFIHGFAITNSIFTGWATSIVLILLCFMLRGTLKTIPGKFQSIVEMGYEWLFDTSKEIIGREDVAIEVIPYVLTLFFFILVGNWTEVLPGFGSVGFQEIHHGKDLLVPLLRPPTSDLNMVAALSVLTVVYVQYIGAKYAGVKGYFGRFFNFSSFIGFFVGVLELIGEFTRIISFSFRLFGNIFAGDVLLAVMFFLTLGMLQFFPILPLPFLFLELFVGAVQAFIFVFLTIVFISLAVISHDTEGHEHGGEDLTLARKVATSEHLIEHELLHNKPN